MCRWIIPMSSFEDGRDSAVAAARAAVRREEGPSAATAGRDRRRASRPDRRGVTPRTSSTDPRRADGGADREEGIQPRRGRSRLAGRVSRQPVGSAHRRRRGRRTGARAASRASRRGCGATATSRVRRLAARTERRPRGDRRPASTGWTSTACTARSRGPRLPGRGRPGPRAAPARATPASNTSARTARLRLRGGVRADARRAKTGGRAAAGTCSGALEYAQPRRPLAEDELFAAEQNAQAGEKRGRVLPRRCTAAARRRGTCATRHMADTLDALVAHLARQRRPRARSWCGRTTRTSATPGRRRWPRAAS